MTAWERANRPKPPRITSEEYGAYHFRHNTISVWANAATESLGKWDVDEACDACMDTHFKSFPTHAEAIQYAHKNAAERSQQ